MFYMLVFLLTPLFLYLYAIWMCCICLSQVWTASSGFCFVTFSEHTNAVTALHFMANNHCLLSASLDGTVRAWDLFRYRNFRTFTTPSSRQFVSLAADQSGEVICAGTLDSFEVLIFFLLHWDQSAVFIIYFFLDRVLNFCLQKIFVWSMKTGRLLDILSGHGGPVHGLIFSPTNVSCIWYLYLHFLVIHPLFCVNRSWFLCFV